MEMVASHFRPEFINRVDELVVFHPLDKAELRRITEIQLSHLRERLESMGIGLSVTEVAVDTLAEAGFDPVYGARPLKRTIQQAIENPLANELLAARFAPGDSITVDRRGDSYSFEKSAVKAA